MCRCILLARCFMRLCYKCGMYINSRGKRSLDGQNEFDTPEDDLGDEARMFYQRKQKNVRWTNRNSQQMDAMLRSELPDEFDLPVGAHISTESPNLSESGDGIDLNTSKSKGKGRHRRRSVNDHIERCVFLLKSRCCRAFSSIATYIGYRVRRY